MDFFSDSLAATDDLVATALSQELKRQNDQIELIASENIVSKAVLEAQGSVLTNKYAEGYSGKRYYGGCAYADEIEDIACRRLKKLFDCEYVNVQPHSGSQANQAVFLALLSPGDTILGMSLNEGGHLTHGSPVNLSGKWFKGVTYGVDKKTHLIDYDQVREIAKAHNPRLIIAGGSAYSRIINFDYFRQIADEVGAYLMVDMAHFSGLVATGFYPSPLNYADIVTSTTHKTLRGPRGGIILTQNQEISKKINSAIFPGLQGGPLMHVIAAKAVAFKEALEESFKTYIKDVIHHAKILAETLQNYDISIISGGTDTHLILADLTSLNITGKEAESLLESVYITCNKNAIPFDTRSPFVTSGIRLGSPALTTRGFKEQEFSQIGQWIGQILQKSSHKKLKESDLSEIRTAVLNMCGGFPLYKI